MKQSSGYLNFTDNFNRNILTDLFRDEILALPIYTFKKKLMDNIGYFDENMIDAQHDFYLRVASQFKVFYIAKSLVFMKKHESNISKNFRISAYLNYIKSLKKLKKEKLISYFKYKSMNSVVYIKLGMELIKINKKKAKIYFLKSFLENPFSYIGFKSIYYYLKLNYRN